MSEQWAYVLVFAVTLLAYFPAIRGGFIWDDDAHVTRPDLRSLHGLGRIWFDIHATQQYYPLLHSAFWLEHRLWGDAVVYYHLVNILLHATSACLLVLVLRRLSVAGAWLAAFVFALHPVCVESVAWITEQKNTLSTVFYLLSVLAYLRFDEKRRPGTYAAALFFFVLALLSKSVTATLPAALLVIFWWRRGRLSWRRDVVPLLPWFVIGATAGLFTSWVERQLGAEGADFTLSFAQRFLVAGRVVWFYGTKLVWPFPLDFIYPRWDVNAAALWQYGFPLAVIVLVGVLWWWRGRSRAPLAGVLFFAGTLFPVLGFLNVYPFIFSFVADHFQYLASLGLLVPLSAGVTVALEHIPPSLKTARWILPGLLLTALGGLTWRQCGMYRDAETLYRTTLARNPACWMAHDNLGVILFQRKQVAEAIGHYEEAIRLKSNNPTAHLDYGAALDEVGKRAEALQEYEKALQLRPEMVAAHRDLGILLVQMNRASEAIDHYRQALKIRPDIAELHEDLGNALFQSGRPADAIEEFETTRRLDPNYAEADLNLGIALASLGKIPDAIACYEQALRLNPNYASAHNNLGVALAQSRHFEEAIGHYQQALLTEPDNADAHYNLGLALVRTGKSADAVGQFQAATRLKPDYAKAHHNLGVLFMQLGRMPEAIGEFEQAVRINPNDAEARKGLEQLRAQSAAAAGK
ncbi:MAG TPA: tetratricopeptide repeat protein [Opitutaceae bacterium]|nr:tetratricopeptide repeat protein [Opitutaceae bacterium]